MGFEVNKRISQLKPSATVKVMDMAKNLKRQGIDVIDLGGGEPDFDSPQLAIDQAIMGLKDSDTHYVDSRGVKELREGIARKLKEENAIEVCSETGIIVTPGGKQALFLALFTFLNPGDEVLVLDPSWVSYESIITIAGGVPVRVPLKYEDNYTITIEAVQSKLTEKTKMIIVNTPNNPSGRMLTDNEASVLEFVIKKFNLIAVSDEIYEYIRYDERKHLSLGSIETIKDQVITINGFSKNYAMTGWRLGYLAASTQLVKSMLKLHQHSTTCVTSFGQAGAIAALDCKEDVEKMLLAYQERRDYFVTALNEIPGIECPQPDGAFYVMPKITHKEMDSFALADLLLNECNIACTPGQAFSEDIKHCVRMSFATSIDQLEKAVKRLMTYFRA